MLLPPREPGRRDPWQRNFPGSFEYPAAAARNACRDWLGSDETKSTTAAALTIAGHGSVDLDYQAGMEATSFAARRPAATTLPPFTLPQPDIPRVATDVLSPVSSGVHSGSSQSSQPGTTPGMYYSHVGGTWPTPNNHGSSYTFANSNANQSGSSLMQPPYSSSRSVYSAAPQSMQHFGQNVRSASASSSTDGMPPPTYQESPAFLTPISGGGGPQNTLPSQGPSQHLPNTSILSSQSPAAQNTPSSGPPAAENGYRSPHPAGPYYPPSSTPQQSSFPTFAPNGGPGPSPTAPSPPTSGAASRALSSISSQPGSVSGMAPPMGYAANRPQPPPYSNYQIPGNPVLTNMHHPGAPLSVVGGVAGMGMPPGYGPGHHGHHAMNMYAHSQPPAQQDRPFKCDQCRQSFNRNHDLKRHKRIHLAVKPYPCTFCDKSFSRKDALKRHRLVKGCGEKALAEGKGSATNGSSPPERSEIMSDGTEGSPNMKKE